MYYQEVKEFATNYRKELQPMMKKMGFKVSVTTFKEYFDEGKLIVTINSVPKNFHFQDFRNCFLSFIYLK